MIYTVPWFPGLDTFPEPQIPGPAVRCCLYVAALIQVCAAIGVPDFDDVVDEAVERMGLTRDHAFKAAGLAMILGMCGHVPDPRVRFERVQRN